MYSSCQCSPKDSGNVYTDIILKGKLFSSTIIINQKCIRLVYKHLFYSLLLLLLIGRFRANSTKMATTTRHDKLRIETLLSPPPTEENGGLPFLHLPPLEMPKIHVAYSQLANNAMATQQQGSATTIANKPKPFSPWTSFCVFQRRAKAKRKRASPWQTQILEQVFEQTAFPTSSLRAELGFELGMTSRSIQIWFQNKRQAVRRSIRHKTSWYP